VEAPGFQVLERLNIQLSSSERLSTGDLVLQIGTVKEIVDVKGEATPVQTSGLLDSNHVTNLTTRGRDVFRLLATMPGVIYDGRGDGLGTQGSPVAFSGARGTYGAANVDGVSGNTRGGNSLDTPVNMDTVAELKVLLNNYQAEYGEGAAGVINVVTKSGTPEFHGLAYYYVRNEAFNANTYFNNLAGLRLGVTGTTPWAATSADLFMFPDTSTGPKISFSSSPKSTCLQPLRRTLDITPCQQPVSERATSTSPSEPRMDRSTPPRRS